MALADAKVHDGGHGHDRPAGGLEGAAVKPGLAVTVVYSGRPREVDSVVLQMAPGATVADALRASGLPERHGWVLDEHLSVGIWSKPKTLATPLRDADRVEVYRGLLVDPKEARRQRYRKPAKRKSGQGSLY